MNRTFCYEITKKDSPSTVESFLRGRGYSRQILIHLKQTPDGILVNKEPVWTTQQLLPGDRLDIFMKETSPSEHIAPAELPLTIVYEDEDLLVISKAADMPIHPSFQNRSNTLANGLAFYYQEKELPFVFRCINRLDRDTTGLLVAAKNMLSASILSAQMKAREIKRTYLAVTDGVPHPPFGTIDAPIARKTGSVIERCVDFETGERAVTHYQVRRSSEDISLTELHLETGRTHQIRVHMQYKGTPLLGDYLYHPAFSRISRVALHSWKLEFEHPITKEAMHFTAPLPPDMAGLFSI